MGDVTLYLLTEPCRTIRLGVRADTRRIKLHLLEPHHCLGETFPSSLGKIHPRDSLFRRLEDAAGGIGNHRPPGRHGFNRGNAKIFHLGENKCARVSKYFRARFPREVSRKADGGASQREQTTLCAAASENDQFHAKTVKCRHHQIKPFALHESAPGQEISSLTPPEGKCVSVHGRINYRADRKSTR